MELLRSRFAAVLAAAAFAVALSACGDDDGKGAAETIEQGVKKGAKEVKKQGRELEDDVRGKDEKKQKKGKAKKKKQKK